MTQPFSLYKDHIGQLVRIFPRSDGSVLYQYLGQDISPMSKESFNRYVERGFLTLVNPSPLEILLYS